MVGAIARGLTLADFEVMTVGMIIGYITTYNNVYTKDDNKEQIREANQSDFNNF